METKMTKEEAIKILMGYSHTPQERAALEVLIPELAESEDERIWKWIVKFIVEQYPECWKDKKNKMLAYLEKQKEQKPAEWSEEDEKMLARIIERGQSQIQMFETGLLPEHITWLKSLRPWKPSEGQMAMLLAVINDPNNAGAESCHLALKSIYEQLKKL